jgi:hypothetical protein
MMKPFFSHHGWNNFQFESINNRHLFSSHFHLTIPMAPAIISELLEKSLLEDIEQKGLPFDQISLVQLCNDKELIYGPPSSALRRKIQKHFNKLKNRTPSNYQKLLVKYSIVPGPFTFHRLREADDSPTKIPVKEPTIDDIEEETIEETPCIDEASIESASESSIDESSIDIARQLETLSIQGPPRIMMTTPSRTPPRKKAPSIASPGFASPIFASPLRPSLDETSLTGEEERDDVGYTILDFLHQNGTKDQPYIVMADPNFPEQNGNFDITRLEDIEHNDYEHQGFHIRLSIDLPDYSGWEAFIPNPNDYPSLLPLYGRIIMFKGPSRPFWLRDHTRYHADNKKIDCQVTRKAHEKAETAIKGERLFSYHLVVLKPGIVLDNSIFSNNNENVKMYQLSMRMDDTEDDNDFEKKIYGMAVWWKIAVAGGTRIRNAGRNKVAAKSLLD